MKSALTRSTPLLGLLAAAACGPAHIGDYVPKHREYSLPESTSRSEEPAAPGSLWRDDNRASTLYADERAFREHDIVVVKIEERADARRTAETDVQRSSHTNVGLRAVPIVGPFIPSTYQADISGSLDGDTAMRGDGLTGRTERLVATCPAVVMKVLPNGNLFVEGHRVVLVNNEEQHLYVSGIIRPIDIDQENSVRSSLISEAEIEFVGRGVVSDAQNPGFFTRLMSFIWPF